jgi:hypothetical protein
MKRLAIAALLAGTAAAGIAIAGSVAAPSTGAAATPVVIELYQSQGCSSCPPADALLNRLADRPNLLPLSFAVTYWDSLGWKDQFGDPAYTQRQWDYAHAQGRGNVATPQFVVNGTAILSGSDPAELARAVHDARSGPPAPAIRAEGRRVTIGAVTGAHPATVWLVRYDPRPRIVNIGRGENSGRSIVQRDVVTNLRAVAQWRGSQLSFEQPPYRDPQQRTALLVQQGRGGPIIAAARL